MSNRPDTSLPHPVHCGRHFPGHDVHWIQALHTANKPEVSSLSWWGNIIDIDGEVITVASLTGITVRYRNHQSERLAATVALCGARVKVNDSYAILRVHQWCFSIAVDNGQPLDGCAAQVTLAPPSTANYASTDRVDRRLPGAGAHRRGTWGFGIDPVRWWRRGKRRNC